MDWLSARRRLRRRSKTTPLPLPSDGRGRNFVMPPRRPLITGLIQRSVFGALETHFHAFAAELDRLWRRAGADGFDGEVSHITGPFFHSCVRFNCEPMFGVVPFEMNPHRLRI